MTDSSYDGTDGAQVLKTDVLGRVKTSKVQRERLLNEFERSGLSGTKFAAVAGVNYQTFASWLQKRRRSTGAYAKVQPSNEPTSVERQKVELLNPALQWLEAVVVEDKDKRQQPCEVTEPYPCTMKLHLPGGVCVDVDICQAGQIPLAVELIAQLKLRLTSPC